MAIEQMAQEHLEGCARLFVDVFGAAPWSEPWTVETARVRLAEVMGTPGAFGLVQMGEEVEAFAAGFGEQGYDGRVFYIKEMCVAPDLQRRGVGTALLRALEGALAAANYGHVYLLTHREGAAEAFYAGNGYRTSRRTVVMSRPLTAERED